MSPDDRPKGFSERSIDEYDLIAFKMATRLQAFYRAVKTRVAMNEVRANAAIVSTDAFGDLVGRNDSQYYMQDLINQKHRLQEQIKSLEHNMYYAKASHQKEVRRLTKQARVCHAPL